MPRQLYHLQVEGCGFPKWYNMPVKVLSVVCGLYEEKWLLFDHLGYFLTHLPTGREIGNDNDGDTALHMK